MLKFLSQWDVAVCALDLRKLRFCRTGNLGGIASWRKKKNLVACSDKGKWAVLQRDYELHTFDGTDSKGAELFEQRDLFQPDCPPAP